MERSLPHEHPHDEDIDETHPRTDGKKDKKAMRKLRRILASEGLRNAGIIRDSAFNERWPPRKIDWLYGQILKRLNAEDIAIWSSDLSMSMIRGDLSNTRYFKPLTYADSDADFAKVLAQKYVDRSRRASVKRVLANDREYGQMIMQIQGYLESDGHEVSWDMVADRMGMGLSGKKDLELEFAKLPHGKQVRLLKKHTLDY